MSKNKKNLNFDNYWMGMAFMAASLGTKGCVIVDSSNQLLVMTNDSDSNLRVNPEVKALFNKPKSVGCILYMTHTPNYEDCLLFLTAEIRNVVYFPSEELTEDELIKLKSIPINLIKFNGNLNWMRDYVNKQFKEFERLANNI